MAYRSFRPSGFEARGVRKVTTGILLRSFAAFALSSLSIMAMQNDTAAVSGYAPLDPSSVMETHTPLEELAALQPAPPTTLAVNALSQGSIDLLWKSMTTGSKARLLPVMVETGGQPPIQAWASTWKAGDQSSQTKGTAQIAYNSFPSIVAELKAVLAKAPSKLNLSQVIWRKHHDYRLLPKALEISHMAEAYHSKECFPVLGHTWVTGNKVELLNLEGAECNESRKMCTSTGAMWRKPDGKFISPEEKSTYRGPTLCIHSCFGKPCYAPYPVSERVATLNSAHRGKRAFGRFKEIDENNPKDKKAKGAKLTDHFRSVGKELNL